jgi:hypothetical protein
MRLLAIAGDVQALIADIRLVTPLRALCAARGWSLLLRNFHDCRRADLAAADVLVVQRGATAGVLRLQRAMRRGGGAVVCEIDDLLTEIAPHISNRAAVLARLPLLRACLAESDLLSVSTARLGAMLRETMPALPAAVVVPNHAPPPSDTPLPAQAASPVTLLFASTEHLDTGFVLPALSALQRERGDAAQIVVVGPPGAAFEAAGLVVRREPVRPRADFLALARGLPSPVGVIPLEATRFAAGKSAIKWFDYAELGLPTLASAVPPYVDVVDDGVTGWLVPNTAADWQRALQAAIDDATARTRIAVTARQAVRERHGPDRTVAAWGEAIEQALQARAAARLPPLGAADRLAGWRDDVLAGLRALNRARLARRAARKST